jgi:hypothetical protein
MIIIVLRIREDRDDNNNGDDKYDNTRDDK